MEEYQKQFKISPRTIFALGDSIYTDYPLTPDLLVHELVHIKQQEKVGVKEWVYDFLYDIESRLKFEVEAYRKQLMSIKDRNHRHKIRMESARNLSSELYGSIISYDDAFKIIGV